MRRNWLPPSFSTVFDHCSVFHCSADTCSAGSTHTPKYCIPTHANKDTKLYTQSDLHTDHIKMLLTEVSYVCVCVSIFACVHIHFACVSTARLPGGHHAGFGNYVSMLTFSRMRSCPQKHLPQLPPATCFFPSTPSPLILMFSTVLCLFSPYIPVFSHLSLSPPCFLSP